MYHYSVPLLELRSYQIKFFDPAHSTVPPSPGPTPHIALYTKSVNMRSFHPINLRQHDPVFAAVSLLYKLKNLRRMRVHPSYTRNVNGSWRTWRNIYPSLSLPALEVFQWYYTPSNSLTDFLNLNDLLLVLAAASRLKEFTAQYCYAERGSRNEVPEEIAPLRLTELLLTPGFDFSTMTSLGFRLAHISGEWLGVLFSATKNLKSFIYDDEDEYDYTLPDFSPLQFLAALKKVAGTLEVLEFHAPHIAGNEPTIGPFGEFPRLEVLIINYHWLVEPASTGVLIDVLPPNVASLSLDCFRGCEQDYFADVTEVVQAKSRGRYKNLSQLESKLNSYREDGLILQESEFKSL
ncbi:hypothetical protein K440DRAFT_100314 [Wilcoxina mikolae CBS 423.85]|nr:hypothetical protein K440DRAFT_100314 [Wilcoxina mikolae CBS 423.85]